MKKNISVQVLIIALSLLLCACGNEPVKSVLEQNNMRGAIRTVTETAYLPSSSDTLAFGYHELRRIGLGHKQGGLYLQRQFARCNRDCLQFVRENIGRIPQQIRT